MSNPAPIVIVGAGPAGMVLAYLLASNGVPVRVLERHKDFDREFRGEFAQPSVLEVLEGLGVLAELRREGRVMPIRAVRMFHGTRAFASNVAPDGRASGEAVHQPSLLRLLDEQCARFAHYRLDLGSPVKGVFEERGRVAGVIARQEGREERIEAALVVVANGRASALRKSVGLEAVQLERPYNVLWLRFDLSAHPELVPETLDGYVSKRAFCLLYPTYGARAQLMWRRSRSNPLDWKAPFETLKAELLLDAPPAFRRVVDLFDEETERQVLHVLCDRLPRWWAPGVVVLGDAAHTMSPMGGQGLTIAIRDAVVASNHLIRAHREGTLASDAVGASIEEERRPEIEAMQAFQVRITRINDAPAALQWVMAKAIIPLATRLQGGSYLRRIQHGVTTVQVECTRPIEPRRR